MRVMERIARRKECEARRSGSPKGILLCKIQLKMKNEELKIIGRHNADLIYFSELK
jgi:hypothetical protein